MYDYLELGASPCDEDCIQVTRDMDYMSAMRDELLRYKTMLISRFPVPDNVQAYFTIKYFPHDFGTYGEVCIKYNEDDHISCEFAYHVEDNLPNTWDDTSIIRFVTREIEGE